MQNSCKNQYTDLKMFLEIFYWTTEKIESVLFFQWISMNLLQNVFQLNGFKNTQLRLFANGLLLYFKSRKNIRKCFIFPIDAKTVSNGFLWIDSKIRNCVCLQCFDGCCNVKQRKKHSHLFSCNGFLRISLEWVFTELFQKNMRLFANRLIAVTEPTNHIIHRNDITTEHWVVQKNSCFYEKAEKRRYIWDESWKSV